MPVVNSIVVYRGEDIELNFTMTPTTDITGWVFSLTVARRSNMQDKLFQFTGVATVAPSGKFQFIIPSATLDIEPGTYFHDVFRTSPSRKIASVGPFEIKPDARFPD